MFKAKGNYIKNDFFKFVGDSIYFIAQAWTILFNLTESDIIDEKKTYCIINLNDDGSFV